MVAKLSCCVPQHCGISQDEENKRNNLRRNKITMKIISRQFDEVLAKNNKLQ